MLKQNNIKGNYVKRIVILYVLMILLIAGFVDLANTSQWAELFSFIKFSHRLHIIIEGINSLLMFLVFIVGNYMYSKIKDERLIILAGGFLIGSIFNCIHIICMTTFPFDSLSIANIQKNPTMVYLLFSNLSLPLSIYYAFIHKPSQLDSGNFKLKAYANYFYIFLLLSICPLLCNYFFPALTYKFSIIIHAIEFINDSLYIMLAFMVINIRHSSKLSFFPMFTTGLLILGLGGVLYINPQSIQFNEILAHIAETAGLVFVLSGIRHFYTYTKFLKFNDELVAFLCLILISFYIVFVSIASALFKIAFPPFSAYLFIEFLLVFQFIIYLLVNKLTQPITAITKALSEYNPGEEPVLIPVIRQDEIGILTEKINTAAMLSWQRILEISEIAERERIIRRIFEAMRRTTDTNIIKNTIVDEISKAFNTDRCFIVLYNASDNSFYFDRYAEQLPSKTLKDSSDIDAAALEFEEFNDAFHNNIEICFANIEEYINKNSLQSTPQEKLLKEYNIKSYCSIPIEYADKLLGYVVLQYTNAYRTLTEDDLSFLKIIATQIGIAMS